MDVLAAFFAGLLGGFIAVAIVARVLLAKLRKDPFFKTMMAFKTPIHEDTI